MYSGDPSVADGGIVGLPAVGLGDPSTNDSVTLNEPSASAPVQTPDVIDSYAADEVPNDLDTSFWKVTRRSTTFDPPQVATTARNSWQRRYAITLIMIDLLSSCAAVAVALILHTVLRRYQVAHSDPVVFTVFAIALPLAWVGVIGLNRAYQSRFVGVGATEFQLVFRAFWHIAALVAIVAYAAKAESARAVVLAALPLTLVFDLLARYAARKRLHRRRARGLSMTSVVAVGGAASVAAFTAMVRHDRYAGMQVIGACLPNEQAMDSYTAGLLEGLDVPVLGDVDSVLQAVQTSGAHTVAVLSGEISADKLRWVSWQLEGTDTDLVVSPGLTEVAGTRLHIQPVAGLPLLHVEEPEFTGVRRVVKGFIDMVAAAFGLLLLAPLFLALAVMIKCDSRGNRCSSSRPASVATAGPSA